MDGWQEITMRWAIFLVGIGSFVFVVWKRHREGKGAQLAALLGFPAGLVVVALFARQVASVELGPVKLRLAAEKAAAAKLVEQQPKVAEAITKKTGSDAVRAALKQIEEAKGTEDLQKILPSVNVGNAVYFFPPGTVGDTVYKVENVGAESGGKVQALVPVAPPNG